MAGGYDVNLKDEAANCLYDMVEVPDRSYVVTDDIGKSYLCDSRCFCIWAVLLATKPNLDEKIKT